MSPSSLTGITAGSRLASLDIYRGLVIVVMTLVNYLARVEGVPAWSKHWPESMEGYTYVDVVFPAFLFVVGVAIPLALQRRLSRGDSAWALSGKLFLRSAVLIFLGVITVNTSHYSESGALMSKPAWFFCVLVCALAVWNACPADASPRYRRIHRAMQMAGGVGLIIFLCLFRGVSKTGQAVWLQTDYWGMLGMIGWSYLIASLVWLLLRGHSAGLMGAMWFMLLFYIGSRHHALDWAPLGWLGYSPMGFDNAAFILGANPATVMMGVVVGNYLLEPTASPAARVRFALLLGLGLFVIGSVVRPLHGINKSAHTEAYALVTGGISCFLFGLVYWAVDVKRWRCWDRFLVPIGQNALLAYILPYILGYGFAIFGLSLYWSKAGLAGEFSAVILTAALLALIWGLTRWRFVLKL